jgi:hypothetical protein
MATLELLAAAAPTRIVLVGQYLWRLTHDLKARANVGVSLFSAQHSLYYGL